MHELLHCGGFSCFGTQALKLWLVDSVVVARRLWSTSSVVVVLKLSCPAACGIFLDQGSNTCLPHWQADSFPLSHYGNLKKQEILEKEKQMLECSKNKKDHQEARPDAQGREVGEGRRR